MKRRRPAIDTSEAIRRIGKITPMLQKDVTTAALSHVVLEVANEMVPKALAGVHLPSAAIYGAGQNALALKVAMDLARIFDISEAFAAEEQDKASVPVLAALVRRPDVQEVMDRGAGLWFPGTGHVLDTGLSPAVRDEIARLVEEGLKAKYRAGHRQAVHDFLGVVDQLSSNGSMEKAALERIRQFRTRRLAHSLFDQEPDEFPKYDDLRVLLAVAKSASKYASLAILGLNVDFDERAQYDRTDAKDFYTRLIDGLKRI